MYKSHQETEQKTKDNIKRKKSIILIFYNPDVYSKISQVWKKQKQFTILQVLKQSKIDYNNKKLQNCYKYRVLLYKFDRCWAYNITDIHLFGYFTSLW